MSQDAGASVGDATKAATAALDIDKIIEKLLEVREIQQRNSEPAARCHLRFVCNAFFFSAPSASRCALR